MTEADEKLLEIEYKEKRKRVLTDGDIKALADELKGHTNCNMGLTPDEVSTLKRILSAFDSAAGIVGKVILTALVVALIGIVTKGFWLSMAQGVKQAPIK